MTPFCRIPHRRRPAATLVLLALLAGCSSTAGTASDPATELAARPSAQEIIARYEDMQQRIRDRLDAELGPRGWERRSAGTRAGCDGEFANTDGARVWMPRWGFRGGVADRDWVRVEQITDEITAEFGFTSPLLQVDEPGRHETGAADPALGAQFLLSARGDTTLAVITGCHRPAG